jgi:Tol biopolymer transport system component
MTHWSPDGTRVLFQGRIGQENADIWTLSLVGDHKPEKYISTGYTELGGRYSPDGRYVAYRSDESGRNEVYVQAAPASSAPQGKWLISRNGGLGMAHWRKDGRELIYMSIDGSVMAVDVNTSGAFQSGTPRKLFDVPQSFRSLFGNFASGLPGTLADVAPDGQRFLFALPPDQPTIEPYTVVTGWRP